MKTAFRKNTCEITRVPLTEAALLDSCIKYNKKYGRNPTQYCDLIEEGAAADGKRTYVGINGALRQKLGSVTPELSDKYSSIPDFCQKNGIGVLTLEQLLDSCRCYYRSNGRMPTQENRLITEGAAANGVRTFVGVNAALEDKAKSISKELQEKGGSSLSEFCLIYRREIMSPVHPGKKVKINNLQPA